IAFGEHARRIVFYKERLKSLDLLFSCSDATVFSGTDNQQVPRRDVVGQFEVDPGASLFVGFDRRLPEQCFREVLSQTWRRHLLRDSTSSDGLFAGAYRR